MPSDDATPAPVKASRRKSLTLVACAAVLAGLVLVVLLNVDQPADTTRPSPPSMLEKIQPPSAGARADLTMDGPIDPVVPLPEGGSLQIPDRETGALAQQYFFARLDPNPPGHGPGWIRMTDPRLEVYLSGDRVAVLTGDSALAYRPNEVFESGTVTGHVEIELYEDVAVRPIDRAGRAPSLIVRTEEARFDNVLGEVLCEGAVHMETRAGEFAGHHLRMLIDDQQGTVRTNVQRLVGIRLAGRAAEPAAAPPPSGPRAAPTRRSAAESAEAAPPDVPAGAPTAEAARPDDDAGEEAAPRDDDSFYLLTLHDDVRIDQGPADRRRTVRGDVATVIFTMRSETGSASESAPATEPKAADTQATTVAAKATTTNATVAAEPEGEATEATNAQTREIHAAVSDARRRLAPPAADDDTIITCRGPLTIEPLEDPARHLASPRDALLQLTGAPVRLDDGAGEAHARCGEVRYHLRPGRLELVGTAAHALVMTSREFEAQGELFWYRDAKAAGGFTGPGVLRLRDAATARDAAAGPEMRSGERLTVEWQRAVDLHFARGIGDTTALERAVFTGDVRARGSSVAFSPDGAEAPAATTGTMDADEIELQMGDEGDGLAPRRVIARRAVRLSDERQTLWAERVDASLAADGDGGRTQVRHVLAEGDVQLLGEQGERVLADQLEVDGDLRTAVVTGDNVRILDDRHVIDQARRIEIDEGRRRYQVRSGGRLRRFDQPVAPTQPRRLSPAALDSVPGREELRVTWRDGVDLAPVEATPDPDGEPNDALFRGDVQVASPDLRLAHADSLRVRFADGADVDGGAASIEAITATGDVRTRALGREDGAGRPLVLGAMSCDALHLTMKSGPDGRAVPDRLHASGAVHVADDAQQMWTRDLAVTFRAADPSSDGSAAAPGIGRAELQRVEANDGVHLRLPDGQHVFGDRFVAVAARGEGDRPSGVADLYGDRVLVIAEEFVLDDVRHLTIDTTARRYRVNGSGAFQSFHAPVAMPSLAGPLEIPAFEPPAARAVEAVWTDSATYAEGDDGTGTLTLDGGVRAESRPGATELNTVAARTLVLAFASGGGEAAAPTTGAAGRQLVSLQARGDARLESRTWREEDRADTPRVFAVSGEDIRYDQRSMEADVTGAGELLIRDTAGGASAAGHRGATVFRWSKRLRLEPVVEERYLITMDGDVEYLHRDEAGATTALTGQYLEADVERQVDDESEEPPRRGAIELGGSMEPRRLQGRGGLRIRTSRGRDVACDSFEYDTLTGLAVVSAAPGELVSVMTEDSTRPFRAERLLWNMREDTITIDRASTTGAP